MAKLSKKTVDGYQPDQKDYFVWDERLAGFGVRVMPSGVKTYQVQYRCGGRTRRRSLGRHGAVTVDQARAMAKDILGQVAAGGDPVAAFASDRRAPLIDDLCSKFMDEYVQQHCKPRTAKGYGYLIGKHIRPAFGGMRVTAVSRQDIAALHHRMRDIPYNANRTLSVLSKMFKLAEVWELRPEGSNPCRLVSKHREKARERFLDASELTRLGEVLCEAERTGQELPFVIAAFRLLILTGCRLGEIQTLKWAYVDTTHINLPDSKTGARRIPLPKAARVILQRLPRVEDNPYVMADEGTSQPIRDLQRPWQRLKAQARLEDVRIHDLRHTYASNAVSSGMPIQMVGKLLGHRNLHTTMRYAHLADDAVQSAAEENAARLDALVGSSAS